MRKINRSIGILFFIFLLIIVAIKYTPSPKETESFENRDDFYIEKNPITYSSIGNKNKTLMAVVANGINIYDIKTKKIIQKLGSHQDFINVAKLSQKGDFAVSLSSHHIKVWSIKKNILIKEITLAKSYEVGDVLISKDGETLGYATTEGKIIMQDVKSGTRLHSFQHGEKKISSIVLSQDEKILVSASWDGTIKIWNLEQDRLLQTIQTDGKSICDVKISADNQTLLSSSYFSINSWTIKGEHLQTLDSYDFNYTLLDMSPNGETIVSIGKFIKIWKRENGAFVLFKQFKNPKHNVSPVDISQDSSMVAIAGEIIDLKSGEVIQEIGSYLREIKSIQIAKKSKTLIVDLKGSTSFWNLEEERLVATSKRDEESLNDDVKSNNQQIALSYENNLITIKDLKSSEILNEIAYNVGDTTIVAKAISNDGKDIIFANYEGDLLVWNNNQTQPKVIHKAHDDFISSITFTPNETYYVTTSHDKTIKFWDVKNNSLTKILQDNQGVNCVALSEDGNYLLSGSGETYTNAISRHSTKAHLKLWDIEQGVILKSYAGERDTITSVAISSDNRYIVAGTMNSVLYVWEKNHTYCIKELLQDNKNNWIIFNYQDKYFIKDEDGTFLYRTKLIKKEEKK